MSKGKKFWRFLCNLVPGALEMELGYMKNGFSLLLVFICCIFLGEFLRWSDLSFMLGILAWFFAFFHARNLKKLPEEEKREDCYIWDEFFGGKLPSIPNTSVRKWGGAIAIVAGVVSIIRGAMYHIPLDYLWDNAWFSNALDFLPSAIGAMVVIIIGILLIRGKKESLHDESDNT